MLSRLRQIPSFLKGELITLRVDKESQKLTVDGGNNSATELRTAANTLFRSVHDLSNLGKVN